MRDDAPGDSRPKYVVAQEALEATLDATEAFIAKRPDFPIKIGIYSFSSNVSAVSASAWVGCCGMSGSASAPIRYMPVAVS